MAELKSPGGFVFGIQGWVYGEIRPKAITFFIDGTTRVCDHHGNAIPAFVGPHATVVAQLEEALVDWQKLDCAGWPQLTYEKLQDLDYSPPTPLDELLKIKDKSLRADAVKRRKELDAAALELAEAESE